MKWPQHEHGTIWVNPGLKARFVNVPRNASSTTKSRLERRGFREDRAGPDNAGYFTFAWLRDPRTRFVSAWVQWRKEVRDVPGIETVAGTLPDTGPPAVFFEQQIWFLADMRVDYIGAVENLERHLSEIGRRFGIDLDGADLNTTAPETRAELETKLTDAAWNNVKSFYAIDAAAWQSVMK